MFLFIFLYAITPSHPNIASTKLSFTSDFFKSVFAAAPFIHCSAVNFPTFFAGLYAEHYTIRKAKNAASTYVHTET